MPTHQTATMLAQTASGLASRVCNVTRRGEASRARKPVGANVYGAHLNSTRYGAIFMFVICLHVVKMSKMAKIQLIFCQNSIIKSH